MTNLGMTNVGSRGRAPRFTLGTVLGTALLRFCPARTPPGISTCPMSQA